MKNPFWMVYVVEGDSQISIYGSLAEASEEAERMARRARCFVYVLASIGCYSQGRPDLPPLVWEYCKAVEQDAEPTKRMKA